eukprot:461443_1
MGTKHSKKQVKQQPLPNKEFVTIQRIVFEYIRINTSEFPDDLKWIILHYYNRDIDNLLILSLSPYNQYQLLNTCNKQKYTFNTIHYTKRNSTVYEQDVPYCTASNIPYSILPETFSTHIQSNNKYSCNIIFQSGGFWNKQLHSNTSAVIFDHHNLLNTFDKTTSNSQTNTMIDCHEILLPDLPTPMNLHSMIFDKTSCNLITVGSDYNIGKDKSICILNLHTLKWKIYDNILHAIRQRSQLCIIDDVTPNKLFIISSKSYYGEWSVEYVELNNNGDIKDDKSILMHSRCCYSRYGAVSVYNKQLNNIIVGGGHGKSHMGSDATHRQLEIYDLVKDCWRLNGYTKYDHYNASLWCSEMNPNLIYIAGQGSLHAGMYAKDWIELIDLREPNFSNVLFNQKLSQMLRFYDNNSYIRICNV